VRWRRTQGGANGNPQVYRRGQRCERPRGVPATLQPALTRPESLTTTVATGRESSWFTLRWRKLLDLTNETDRGRTRGLHTADLEISKLYHCSLPIKRPQLLQKNRREKSRVGCWGVGLHSFCGTHEISLHYSLQPHRIPGARPRCACC